MDTGMVLSLVTLAVSIAIPILRLVDWLMRADPRVVMSLGRKLHWLATLASVPCFVLLVIYHQWTMAVVLGMVLVLTPVAGNWRSGHFWTTFRPAWQPNKPPDAAYGAGAGAYGQPPDPELVRRAAIVLEDYLVHAGHPGIGGGRDPGALAQGRHGAPPDHSSPMSTEEALDVLGLDAHATAFEIGFAHRRLMMLVHPDRGGTNYLAAKINRAKSVLLANASESRARQA